MFGGCFGGVVLGLGVGVVCLGFGKAGGGVVQSVFGFFLGGVDRAVLEGGGAAGFGGDDVGVGCAIDRDDAGGDVAVSFVDVGIDLGGGWLFLRLFLFWLCGRGAAAGLALFDFDGLAVCASLAVVAFDEHGGWLVGACAFGGGDDGDLALLDQGFDLGGGLGSVRFGRVHGVGRLSGRDALLLFHVKRSGGGRSAPPPLQEDQTGRAFLEMGRGGRAYAALVWYEMGKVRSSCSDARSSSTWASHMRAVS